MVPDSFDTFNKAIKDTYDKLVTDGKIVPTKEVEAPSTPMSLKGRRVPGRGAAHDRLHQHHLRRPGGRSSPTRASPSARSSRTGMGIGDVIGLLWFKRKLPRYASQFIELVLVLTADHGPAVSGAHNCIVTARAGRDLMSAVASGILTIGPRFGGAVSGAAEMFNEALAKKMTPEEFIRHYKKKGRQHPGHRPPG